MINPEKDPVVVSPEQLAPLAEQTRRARQEMGVRALSDYIILPELETGFQRERNFLRSRIINQDQAIDAIVDALDRREVRSWYDNRPIASLAFLGPTGVGKTETAKALSEILGGEDGHLVRIDCSNFSHGHEVASLIGSPPGYVGREQEPILSPERIEQSGTAVVLFDEIEKAAPQLHNLLLQIMDNGRLELNNGETVSFKDAVVIVTSNVGAHEMAKEVKGARAGFSARGAETADSSVLETAALRAFKEFFRPELVNRFDNSVVFQPITEEGLYQVLEVKLDRLNREYRIEHESSISLSDKACEYLVQKALNEPAYGVRPLVRALDSDIVSQFGRYVAYGHVNGQDTTELYVRHRDELGEQVADTHRQDLIFSLRYLPKTHGQVTQDDLIDLRRRVRNGEVAVVSLEEGVSE